MAPPAGASAIDKILRAVEGGEVQPVYLIGGDPVIGEPQGRRLAEALAARAGCEVEEHRRPTTLGPLLADLRTYSLFASAKVTLVVDSAVVADQRAAADLIDRAEKGLPVEDPSAEPSGGQRRAASRLLQALRVFGIEPGTAAGEGTIDALPAWALQGGGALRKRRPRGRSKKEQKALAAGLGELLAMAHASGLVGYAEGDLAELGAIVAGGLPPGHALVLVENAVARDHPLVRTLRESGAAVDVGHVAAGRGGDWQGLEAVAGALERETGVGIAPDALRELARRTLRSTGDWQKKGVSADSTARLAAEYRKLASLVGHGTIDRRAVASAIDDRGEEDVWKILGALGEGRGDEASARFRRMMAGADDAVGARLAFFGLLAGFCRQLTAVVGMMQAAGVRPGERNYNRFKSGQAPALQGALPDGSPSPLAGLHPFRLHRAYLAGSRLAPATAARLPDRVLATELLVKGDSRDPDAAISALIATVAAAIRAGR